VITNSPSAAGPSGHSAHGFLFSAFPIPTRKLTIGFDAVTKMETGRLAQNCLTNTMGNPRYPNATPQTDALLKVLTPYPAASILHPPKLPS
jgi:hypothetical protein